jgi:hypothetical protein
MAIAGIVVVGVLLIVFARSGFSPDAEASPKPGDHWHAAYGFYVCDAFQAPLADATTDRSGIHTHGDGIMHIHPFSNAYSGTNATVSVWGETVGVDFGTDSWTLPDGTEYENGYDCNGQPAQLSVYKWNVDDPSAPPQVFTTDFANIQLDTDRSAFTFAVVPEGTEVPKPDSVPTLDNLSDVAGSPGSTSPPTSTLTVPVDPNAAVDPNATSSTTPAASTPESTPSQ